MPANGSGCTRGLRSRATLTERHCLSLLRVGNWESQEPGTGSGTSPHWEASLPTYSPRTSERQHPFKLSPLHTPCTYQTLTVRPSPQLSNKPLHREGSQTPPPGRISNPHKRSKPALNLPSHASPRTSSLPAPAVQLRVLHPLDLQKQLLRSAAMQRAGLPHHCTGTRFNQGSAQMFCLSCKL